MGNLASKICFFVEGPLALFTDPTSKIGRNPYSYPIPTYEAIRGVAESIYWKPTFNWFIDRVRVMNLIKTQSRGTKPLKWEGGNSLSIVTYLTNVLYQVQAHIDWNPFQVNMELDRDMGKHLSIITSSIELGGRLDPFLGTRECQAYVGPCDFGDGPGAYDSYGEMNFGMLYHSMEYPNRTGKNEKAIRFWRAKMNRGIIDYPDTLDCPNRKLLGLEDPIIFTNKLGVV